MIPTAINIWPILVAAIVAFGIGALWYSPILFGREWMALSKYASTTSGAAASGAGSSSGMWWRYVIQLVSTLVLFAVMGFIVASTGSMTAGDGAFMAFLIWLGFSATSSASDLLWAQKPLKLVLIYEICTLVTWLIGGAIIGAWR